MAFAHSAIFFGEKGGSRRRRASWWKGGSDVMGGAYPMGARPRGLNTLTMTPSELKEVYDEACAFAADLTTRGNHVTGHYVTLLAEPPAVSLAAALEAVPRRLVR